MVVAVIAIVATSLVLAWFIVRLLLAAQFPIKDKVFLITGGSRGLGLVIAREVSRHGGKVVLLARNLEELGRAEDDLVSRGAEVLAIACDLQQRPHIEAAVRRTVERFGRIDVLVNNAGIIQVGPVDHMQRSDYEQSLGLYFWAPCDLTLQVLPHMRNQGGGRIVNISSIGGKIGVPHLAPYCAGKFALTGLSDSLRAELARENIHVTTVAPGLMRTGSHVNAQFKGDHEAEFAWFAASSGTPLISMKAERAARKIVAACRRGQPSLTLTIAARLAIAANAIAPNLTGYTMKVINRLLPQPVEKSGDKLQTGWESRSASSPPRWMTSLADAAIDQNNESLAPHSVR
jgi:NAD(P)-dependent dehydrogenase (short-subunit alcohol dehydrogenase family)